MYSNLYIYGCSHSFGTSFLKNNIPFGKIIAQKLNIENIFNYSSPSIGNQYNRKLLVNSFINEEIKKNSLIIFQNTGYNRKSYELIDSKDVSKFESNVRKLTGNWGDLNKILHILPGMFNRNDSYFDKQLTEFSDTYDLRLSGEHYIMFDDIFSTYSILKLISNEIKNVKFIMISWPEIKEPFEKYLHKELSNIFDWSLQNKLTENDVYNNGDLHLSQEGHEKLAEKILKFL